MAPGWGISPAEGEAGRTQQREATLGGKTQSSRARNAAGRGRSQRTPRPSQGCFLWGFAFPRCQRASLQVRRNRSAPQPGNGV